MQRLIVILLVLVSEFAFSRSFTVHNEAEFTSATRQLVAGDVIIIANGQYTPWSVLDTVNGTRAHPVKIMAETVGKVVFSGDASQPVFTVTGNYTTIEGLSFKGCNLIKTANKSGLLIDIHNAKYSRITNCLFEKNAAKTQFMPMVTISGKGEYNQVDHCSFIGTIDAMDLQVKITKEAYPTYTLINNNTFRDKNKVSWQVYNGGECVQIGQDPVLLGLANATATIRNNTFTNCNAEGEVISNKSSGNLYIKNYFKNCEGELVMRGGHDCVVDSNTFNGGIGGVRVNGSGHQITHNQISGVKTTGIRLMYGMAKGKDEIGFYISPTGCVVTKNRIDHAETGILVGDNKNEDWTGKFDVKRYPSRTMQDVQPADNKIYDNVITNSKHQVIYQ